MLHQLKKNKEFKTLASNIASLGLLQVVNTILPLLTVPYLVRILGPSKFGLLAYAAALIGYFVLITDYGFNLSATRQISIHRDKPKKIREIFNSVIIIKFFLMVLCFVALLLLISIFERLQKESAVYLATFGMVAGEMLFPVWFFQGIEQMRYITALHVAAKLFFTVLIFLFITDESHYVLVPLINSVGLIAVGLLSLVIVRYRFSIRLELQPLRHIRYQLIEGWHIFFSSLAISLYTTSTTFVLGIFSNNATVGYFSAADKIIQALKSLYQPVFQALFPLLGKKMDKNEASGIRVVKLALLIIGAVAFLMSTAVFIKADLIVAVLLGQQYLESVNLLRIMAFLPFIVAISNILGVQIMLNLGHKVAFTWIISIAALLGITLNPLLAFAYSSVGSSIALLTVESFVTISISIYVSTILLKRRPKS